MVRRLFFVITLLFLFAPSGDTLAAPESRSTASSVLRSNSKLRGLGDEASSVQQQVQEMPSSGNIATRALATRAALITKMYNNRQLGLWDERDKEDCCRKAFNLCERPPAYMPRAWAKQQKKVLKLAQNACNKLYIFDGKKLTQQGICKFYSGHPANCAMTPEREEDFERFDFQLKRCCGLAPSMCTDMKNPFLLFNLKRECHWFAKNTAEEICAMDGSWECGEWPVGNETETGDQP